MNIVRKLRTLDEVTEEYFRNHPDEIDSYLTEIFQDYADDNDIKVLLASLRILARVCGISDMAESIGMTPDRGYKKPCPPTATRALIISPLS